ncbi:MAG TPA: histidine kinase, partial [Clostridia bacterium]|nr:histidine kinase [Clostridia bacterium]
ASAGLRVVQLVSAMFAAMTVLVLGFLAWQIHRGIIGPILGIVRQVGRVERNPSRIENPKEACVEFSRLTQGINDMLVRVQSLSDHVMAAQINYLHARIMFLQAQINPHLLYNNLECIRGMAAAGDGESVREMVSCMAALYRYCIRPDDEATLEDELLCVEQYAQIIRLRYGGGYTFSMEVEESLRTCHMPCMTLQPIVENAVSHGFVHAGRRTGHVRVRAEQAGGLLHIWVQDNGAGMPQAQLDAFNAWTPAPQSKNGAHVGIENVRSRLHLIYGSAAGLHFKPAEEGGLSVLFTLPFRNG